MASGKLAPHSSAGGRMVHKQRAISSWNVIHGLSARNGSMGQYGREPAIMYALHAVPSASSNWQQPSARRGRTIRERYDPIQLPSAMPIRNTERMIENTYTVAPISMPIRRVHTTSAPRALAPESPMDTYTGQGDCAGPVETGMGSRSAVPLCA